MQSSSVPPDKKRRPFKGIWRRRTKRQKAAIIVTILLVITFLFIAPRPLTLSISNHGRIDRSINVTVTINGIEVVTTEVYNDGRLPAPRKDFTIWVWGPIDHIVATETDDNISGDATFFGITGGYVYITYPASDFNQKFHFEYSVVPLTFL